MLWFKKSAQFLKDLDYPTFPENVVVTDVIKREDVDEGAVTSDGELPPPPPPAKHSEEEGEHSEEGECDSDPEEGELGDVRFIILLLLSN